MYLPIIYSLFIYMQYTYIPNTSYVLYHHVTIYIHTNIYIYIYIYIYIHLYPYIIIIRFLRDMCMINDIGTH